MSMTGSAQRYFAEVYGVPIEDVETLLTNENGGTLYVHVVKVARGYVDSVSIDCTFTDPTSES